MASQDQKRSTWRRRALGALSVLLLISLASHPELRLLVPFLDAVGLDLFLALLGSQALVFLADTLKPLMLLLWQRAMPAIRSADHALQSHALLQAPFEFLSTGLANYSGTLGQCAWLHLSAIWRILRLGPSDAPRSAPLRGAA